MSNNYLSNQIKIGERLREFRTAKGLKAVELSKICGISQGSLSGLENGKSYPSAETLINLMRQTDISIEWLLTGKGTMTPKKNEEPKNLEEQKPRRRKYEILNELEEWLDEEIRKNRDREGWFELQLIDSFQTFRAWRKERGKEENIEDENTTRKRVA